MGRLLPDKDSPEGQEILKRVKEGQADTLWKGLGYNNRDCFLAAIRKSYGFFISREPIVWQSVEEQLPKPENIIIPDIQLREWKAEKKRRGDEEDAILHCGDGHAGKITPSYNPDVYFTRMDTMFDSIMTIITLHRHMYPIRKLWILNDGDNCQGENPYQGSVVGQVAMGERDQITKLALPAWYKLICSLKQEFEEVQFEGFPGNHGYERLAPETSRADLRLYDILKAKLENKKGITINLHERFGDIVGIMGFRHFITHLDSIPCHMGIPWFGIERALKSWYMQFGGFHYAWGGHFHQKRLGDEVSAAVPDFIMHSTMVSDDDWALKKLKISSSPSQNLVGIHPKYGLTWRYALCIDKTFVPGRLKNKV